MSVIMISLILLQKINSTGPQEQNPPSKNLIKIHIDSGRSFKSNSRAYVMRTKVGQLQAK